ncbi:MAG: hypothetical protein K8R77_00965 [Anaerolineaceae bacterium]|nr:hypothetical protein [Anaerolineaceae bacterium]
MCTITFPVVVIKGKLFEYYLEKDDNPILEEIDTGVLVWRNPIIRMPYTIIHIVTLDGLPEFVENAAETTYNLLNQENAIRDLFNPIHNKNNSNKGIGNILSGKGF